MSEDGMPRVLYYIVSLHQTTTWHHHRRTNGQLYYIVSLHQTTTLHPLRSCVVLLYYIVSLHQTTTKQPNDQIAVCCIISFLYIKPQPTDGTCFCFSCCIISFLYIKPQRITVELTRFVVVLYRFSTSNHNKYQEFMDGVKLYYIVSLHQTTTCVKSQFPAHSCIISFLYIKPQPAA